MRETWEGMKDFAAIVLLVFLSMVLLGLISTAKAAPKVRPQEACVAFADVALVAASHVAAGVSRAQSDAAVALIYDIKLPEHKTLARLIADAAKRYIDEKHGAPRDFAQMFAQVCVMNGGDMDALLGVES